MRKIEKSTQLNKLRKRGKERPLLNSSPCHTA
nr:MAG TPA: hypothetical protein [Caudoviricetes sp.]